jgi:DNA-binding PadR family transcriptional regulator
MPRGHCHRHGATFGPCSCSLGRLSRLAEPTILYLLATGKARYGYELLAQVDDEAMTDSEIDPGVVYRTLQRLEQAGCVTSDWEPGAGGPNRHVYEITQVGRDHLVDWASVLERRAREMLRFVERCHVQQAVPVVDPAR